MADKDTQHTADWMKSKEARVDTKLGIVGIPENPRIPAPTLADLKRYSEGMLRAGELPSAARAFLENFVIVDTVSTEQLEVMQQLLNTHAQVELNAKETGKNAAQVELRRRDQLAGSYKESRHTAQLLANIDGGGTPGLLESFETGGINSLDARITAAAGATTTDAKFTESTESMRILREQFHPNAGVDSSFETAIGGIIKKQSGKEEIAVGNKLTSASKSINEFLQHVESNSTAKYIEGIVGKEPADYTKLKAHIFEVQSALSLELNALKTERGARTTATYATARNPMLQRLSDEELESHIQAADRGIRLYEKSLEDPENVSDFAILQLKETLGNTAIIGQAYLEKGQVKEIANMELDGFLAGVMRQHQEVSQLMVKAESSKTEADKLAANAAVDQFLVRLKRSGQEFINSDSVKRLRSDEASVRKGVTQAKDDYDRYDDREGKQHDLRAQELKTLAKNVEKAIIEARTPEGRVSTPLKHFVRSLQELPRLYDQVLDLLQGEGSTSDTALKRRQTTEGFRETAKASEDALKDLYAQRKALFGNVKIAEYDEETKPAAPTITPDQLSQAEVLAKRVTQLEGLVGNLLGGYDLDDEFFGKNATTYYKAGTTHEARMAAMSDYIDQMPDMSEPMKNTLKARLNAPAAKKPLSQSGTGREFLKSLIRDIFKATPSST